MADYRLCIEGDIDLATAPGLREDVIELLDRRCANVVIDFVGVTFMDCSGIRVLIELQNLLASSGHQLRLVHLPRRARLAIDVLGLTGALHLDCPIGNSATRSNRRNQMDLDLLDLYTRASAWTTSIVPGATGRMAADTPCDGWDVRTLMNHMLDTQNYFVSSARGEDASPPSSPPPGDLLGDDPVEDFRRTRAEIISTFGEPGVIDRTGPSLGIAFSDQLLHGWDLAQATGQDATMPDGLPEAAYQMIHGQFTDDQRKGIFKPEVRVGADAPAQDRLLAYTGREPLP